MELQATTGCVEQLPEREQVCAALLQFLARELALDGDELDGDELDEHTPLLAWGIVSSLTMASLLTFIREAFAVEVQSDEVTVENFEDVAAIAELILARRAGARELPPTTQSRIESQWHALSDGRRIHGLAVRGPAENPPWVLLPGFGMPASSWTSVLQALVDEREALAVDLLGFGAASARPPRHYLDHVADLDELLRACHGQREVVLIASSAGSLIALEQARRAPERVAALVLIGFGVIADPQRWLTELERVFGDPDEFVARAYYRAPRLDADARAQIEAAGRAPGFRSFVRAEELGSAPFAAIGVPTLVIGGTEDRIVGRDAIRAGAEQIADAQLVELARCAHLPGSEQPDETVDAITEFLRELDRERGA